MEKGAQQRQATAVRRLVIFHHQFNRVLLQRYLQFGKIKAWLIVSESQIQLAVSGYAPVTPEY